MGITKQIKKHLAVYPVIFIFSIWFLFASPYFLKGNVPFSSTYQVNNFAPWSTYEQFWGPVKNGAMPDIITQIYPWKHLAIEIWKSGHIPLWNPYSFSGTPLLANYQSAVFTPFNLLFFILPFVDGWSILVLLQPLLAGIFMYLFSTSFKTSKTGGLISAVSFMFCGFITVWMGYATLGYAILFLPLALFSIEKYYATKKLIFLILLSICVPLAFFSGHFQISLYFFAFICSYIFYKFIQIKDIHSTFYLIRHIFLGLLFSMPQILPSLELYTQSFRSTFFYRGSGIPLEYIPTLLVPDFFGSPITRNNWFGYYAEWNAYIGILPLMLAFYSILHKKSGQVLFLLLSGFFALILASNNLISDTIVSLHVPFLATSPINRIIVIFSFTFATLSGIGYDQLILDIKNKKWKLIITWLILFLVFFSAFWIVIIQKLFISLNDVTIARKNLILPTILFIISATVVVTGILLRKIKYFYLFLFLAPFVLLSIVSFDMFRFATKWQAFDPKKLVFADTPTTTAYTKIAGFQRVLGNFGAENSTYYHLPSVEGYDALYSKRYGEFIGFINNGEIIKSAWSVVGFQRDSIRTKKALDLLNIRYISHKLLDNKKSWTFPFWIYPKDQFKLIYKDSKYEFYDNTKVLPHVFLVGKYRVISNPEQILNTIFSKDFDPKREIILEKDPKMINSKEDNGVAKILNYMPNEIGILVDAKNKNLVFLSENYYPGWKASVDGKETSIFRANYTFRAIMVEKGKHTVRFWYDPWSFKWGIYFAIGGLIGMLFMLVIFKKRNRDKIFMQ